MRLNKKDFRELMNEPLVQWLDYPKAREMIARGGQWLDVRLPSEHQNVAIEGSLNVPLYFIRLKISDARPRPTLHRLLRYRPAQFGGSLHSGRTRFQCLCAARRAGCGRGCAAAQP